MEVFFGSKKCLNLHTIIMVSFLSGGYVNEVPHYWTNYQGNQSVHFLQCLTFTVTHFMSGEGVNPEPAT